MNRKKEPTGRGGCGKGSVKFSMSGKLGRNVNLNLLQILDPLSSALLLCMYYSISDLVVCNLSIGYCSGLFVISRIHFR